MNHLSATTSWAQAFLMKIKQTIKSIPVFGPLVLSVYRIFVPAPTPYTFERFAWEAEPLRNEEKTISKIKNLLNYTKTSGSAYSAKHYPAGYHTLRIQDKQLQGQRDPLDRFKKLQIDFAGLRVLDIGCNQGGMLFAVADEIKWGVGVDFDYRMVNCCNKLAGLTGRASKLQFYCFNIDKDPHGLLYDFLPGEEATVDVVFLLAVCMWVDRWQPIIDECAKLTNRLVFESNGEPDVQTAQIEYVKRKFSDVRMIDDGSDGNRQLLIAEK